jgi:Flp pilus assembly protein TadG
MISGWLLKVLLMMAVFGFLVVEVGSPFISRAQLDGTAHEAADEARNALDTKVDAGTAEGVAREQAAQDGATLTFFEIEPDGRVKVTVRKEAFSLFLHRISATKDLYEPQASATSQAPKP